MQLVYSFYFLFCLLVTSIISRRETAGWPRATPFTQPFSANRPRVLSTYERSHGNRENKKNKRVESLSAQMREDRLFFSRKRVVFFVFSVLRFG